MKQSLFILILIFLVVIFMVTGFLMSNNNKKMEIQKENREYEKYAKQGQEVNYTDVATIINKAVNQNEKNSIPKNENQEYIENNTNSIKIEIKMLDIEEPFTMERIHQNGIDKFIQSFGGGGVLMIKFKCTKIEYHQETGLIKKITFEELEVI